MKIRFGFVSNSSSCSFLINKNYLSNHQIELICDHITLINSEWDNWDITEELINGEVYLKGFTIMDNFDMETYLLETVKVKSEHIEWRS